MAKPTPLEAVAAAIREGMARWIWVWAFGNWDEDLSGFSGGSKPDVSVDALIEWDVPASTSWVGAPDTPPVALRAARDLYRLYTTANEATPADLFVLLMEHQWEDAVLGHEDAAAHAFAFGTALAQLAIGGREDLVVAAERFDVTYLHTMNLVVPAFEATYSGEDREFTWQEGVGEASSFGGGRRVILGYQIRNAAGEIAEEGIEDEQDQTGSEILTIYEALDYLLDRRDRGPLQALERYGDEPPTDYRGPFARGAAIEAAAIAPNEETALVYRLENFTDQELRDIHEIVEDTQEMRADLHRTSEATGNARPPDPGLIWGDLIFINSGQTWGNRYILGISGEYLVVNADHFGDAFDEAIDWIADNRPGMLVDDQINEQYQELLKEAAERGEDIEDDDVIQKADQEAREDTMSGGNASESIDSDAMWQAGGDNPTQDQLRELAHRTRSAFNRQGVRR